MAENGKGTSGAKRMLIVHTNLECGGAERSLINFLTECDPALYQVDLMLFSRTGIFLNQLPEHVRLIDPEKTVEQLFTHQKEKCRGAAAFRFKLIRLLGVLLGKMFSPKNWNRARQYRWKLLYRHVIPEMQQEYDVAMAYLEGEASWYVMDKTRAKRKICWFHSDYDKMEYSALLDEDYFRRCDVVATISEGCVSALARNFPSIRERFVCLPNITSESVVRRRATEFFPPEYADDPFRILSVGRFTHEKGMDLAVEAAGELKRRGVKFVWYVVGDGKLRGEVAERAAQLGVKDEFVMLGLRENPYPYVANCDLFVQPSRFEGKSVALDEAKILARPILVTNYPTAVDQIQDGVEGMIVEIDATAIADGAEKLIADQELRTRFMETLKKGSYGNREEICRYYAVLQGDVVLDDTGCNGTKGEI